jgi:hypothetical protein
MKKGVQKSVESYDNSGKDASSTNGECSEEQESEVEMYFGDRISQCSICKSEYTSFHFEITPASKVYVCQDCLEHARDHFIWICLNCGRSYLRPKNLVMNRIHDYGLKEAVFLYENRIIQGIGACVCCCPDLIMEYTDRLGEYAP